MLLSYTAYIVDQMGGSDGITGTVMVKSSMVEISLLDRGFDTVTF